MIGVRRWYYEGDSHRTPVHEREIHMLDGVRDPPSPRFNLLSEDERCPEGYVGNGRRCVEWRPLSTDPLCTGLNRTATEYDTPDPERYTRCLGRARELCARPDADATYCACFHSSGGDRCTPGTACHTAMLDTTFIPDFAHADPMACGVSPQRQESSSAVAYVVLGVAAVAVGVIVLLSISQLRR